MDCEPLAVTGPNVDVNWAEVVVLLMTWWETQAVFLIWKASLIWNIKKHPPESRHALTWCTAARHLHVKLDSVHAQDGVTDVTQHVVAGFHSHESWQLQQLLQLGLPPWKKIKSPKKEEGNVRHCGSSIRKFNMILPFRIRQIYVGPEFNDLSNRFLLWAGKRHKPNMNMLRCMLRPFTRTDHSFSLTSESCWHEEAELCSRWTQNWLLRYDCLYCWIMSERLLWPPIGLESVPHLPHPHSPSPPITHLHELSLQLITNAWLHKFKVSFGKKHLLSQSRFCLHVLISSLQTLKLLNTNYYTSAY